MSTVISIESVGTKLRIIKILKNSTSKESSMSEEELLRLTDEKLIPRKNVDIALQQMVWKGLVTRTRDNRYFCAKEPRAVFSVYEKLRKMMGEEAKRG